MCTAMKNIFYSYSHDNAITLCCIETTETLALDLRIKVLFSDPFNDVFLSHKCLHAHNNASCVLISNIISGFLMFLANEIAHILQLLVLRTWLKKWGI